MSPRRGVAFKTMFNLSCNGWSDDEGDVPLLYHFTALRDTGEGHALGVDSVYASMKVGKTLLFREPRTEGVATNFTHIPAYAPPGAAASLYQPHHSDGNH